MTSQFKLRTSIESLRASRAFGRRVGTYLGPYRGKALLALLAAAGAAVLGLAPALILRAFVDNLQHGRHSFAQSAALVGLGLLALLGSGLLGLADTYLIVGVGKRISAELRQRLFDHLLEQSVGYFTQSRTGELLSRVLNDVGGLDGILGATLLSIVTALCTTTAALVLMFLLCWQLSLVTLILFPLVALSLRLAGRPIYHRQREVQEQFANITDQLQEVLGVSGILLVKSFGREDEERDRFTSANNELRRLEIRSVMAGQWTSVGMSFLGLLGPIALILFGSHLVADHTISLGTLVAFATVAGVGFSSSLLRLSGNLITIIGSLPMWTRVFEVLDHPVEVQVSPHPILVSSLAGSVEFEDVTFTYPGQPNPALAHISLQAKSGQLVALVGPSGAGKTTLSNLIPRFYDPQQGRILIDGNDVRDLASSSIRNAVGMVLQDTFLFHTTLRENLLYGCPEATDADLDNACRHAALTSLIASLPDGYDTLVGERGYRLSGGEKQRVAIARVILKDPAILILDEATSHLDSVSERAIQSAMTELFTGRTSFVIAHRLSTVRSADLIVVLENGWMVESGTHERLLQSGGLYSQLHETQFLSDF
ncbi:MAG TPA: ABC transporter ATP-binding protein [Acidimicrobiales bacterium]|nr:ABC transporter ATP-binding protein [Acidimicrobiales bacterium]